MMTTLEIVSSEINAQISNQRVVLSMQNNQFDNKSQPHRYKESRNNF